MEITKKQEQLINKLNDLSKKLKRGEYKYCNLKINGMAIFFCHKLNVTTDGCLFLYSKAVEDDTTVVIHIKEMQYLEAFHITSKEGKAEIDINYMR